MVKFRMSKSSVWWSMVYDEVALKSFSRFLFMTQVPESPGSSGEDKKINLRFIITSLCSHKGHHSAFESCRPCSCIVISPVKIVRKWKSFIFFLQMLDIPFACAIPVLLSSSSSSTNFSRKTRV